MDKLDKLFDRMTRDMVYYFIAGGLAEPDGLIRTVEFFLSFIDKGMLSEKLLDKKSVKEAIVHHIPEHMPLFIDESFYAYQSLLDLYYALYCEKIITKEECKEMHYFIYLNKSTFLTRMSNPNYWSKTKLAIMDEWREGNFDIEDPYNVKHYEVENTSRKEKNTSNILKFPEQNNSKKQENSYVVRVDLKGFKPPIWRRIQIPTGITYKDLHQILQISFAWENSHLHSFFVDRTNMIGPSDLQMIQFAEEERLIDEDFKQRRKIDYIYDFGCDWKHQIVVEKMITHEVRASKYAICLKGRGDTPEEDSRGEERWLPYDLVNINNELEKEKFK